MNESVQNVKVPIGVSKNTKLDLPSYHITSGDFFLNKPVHYRHLVMGQKYICPVKFYTRLEPPTVPVFGHIVQTVRSFFVPYRLVFNSWNEQSVDTFAFSSVDDVMSLDTAPPWFHSAELSKYFFSQPGLVDIETNPTVYPDGHWNYDFLFNSVAYRCTTNGYRVLTILESLGYKLLDSSQQTPNTGIVYNALALLSLAKIWCDWYANSAYLDSADYLAIQAILNKTKNGGVELQSGDIARIIDAFWYVGYDKDYFTAAFDEPTGPNSPLSSFSFTDFTQVYPRSLGSSASLQDVHVHDLSNGTPVMDGIIRTSGVDYPFAPVVSHYALRSLEVMSDYVKKFQLVGSRASDRLLALWGRKPNSEALKRSLYLGSKDIEFSFGDVMSTAATSRAEIGEYAGQSQAGGEVTFECEAQESGIFIVLTSIRPAYDYWQGFDRHNLHMNRFDFYSGTGFDQLGCQAIAKGELYVSDNGDYSDNDASLYTTHFGYTMRYAEYKVSRSFVTGIYRLHSQAGVSSWHLMRTFYDGLWNDDVRNQVHTLQFTRGKFDFWMYDRIFNNTDNVDHFNMMFYFGATSYAPFCSLFEGFKFDDDDAKKITLNVGGTQVN